MLREVYMVVIERKQDRSIAWHCTGRRERPFVTFNKPSAEGEATKLRNLGYRATVVTVNASQSTCFMDLKKF